MTVSDVQKPKLFSFVFGNKASMNLTIAVGIGSYMFTQGIQKK